MAKKVENKPPKSKGIKKGTPAKKTQPEKKKVAPKKVVKETPIKVAKKEAKKAEKVTAKKAVKNVPKKIVKEEKKRRSDSGMLYDADETPPLRQLLVLAIQHVLAMFGVTILVPLIINGAVGAEIIPIPVALVASAVGTIIYILCTRRKSPVYLGSSVAFIIPILAGYGLAGVDGVFTALFAVGFIYALVAIIIHFAGRGWLDKLLPPAIVGSVLIIIGLGLAYLAVHSIGIGSGYTLEWKDIVVALVSLLVATILALYANGIWKIISLLLGIVAGYVVAIVLGMINFDPVTSAKIFEVPEFQFVFKDWSLHAGALLTIVPLAFIVICENLESYKDLGSIVNKDMEKEPGVIRTLLGSGIATMVSSLCGGPVMSAHNENTSVVKKTKLASTSAIIIAAVIAVLIAFLGHITALLTMIPAPVLGGVSILLYGYIAMNGLRLLIKNQIDFGKIKNVVVVSTMMILAIGGAVISIDIGDVNLTIGSISLAIIMGVILNLVLPDRESEL